MSGSRKVGLEKLHNAEENLVLYSLFKIIMGSKHQCSLWVQQIVIAWKSS